MVDRDLIESKFDIIERNLRFIRENYSSVEPEYLEENYKDYQALKFSLFEIVEACIDIASHIISPERFRRAETYAVMFKVLAENRVISKDLIARFRNFLIHRYGELDTGKLIEIIDRHPIDIEIFMKEIRKRYLR